MHLFKNRLQEWKAEMKGQKPVCVGTDTAQGKAEGKRRARKEVLRVGMRIKYNHPLMVSGTRSAARTAIVEDIRWEEEEYPLRLSTNDFLEWSDFVRVCDEDGEIINID